MNIFVLDLDPKKAARMMCDKHVVKMILESNQMLCTVANQNGFSTPYKSAFTHHPCTKWVGLSIQNWNWLIDHTEELCRQYNIRYLKTHKSEAVLNFVKELDINLPDIGLTPFPKAMPDIYKVDDPVLSYRRYYLGEKSRFAKWKNTEPPDWYTRHVCKNCGSVGTISIICWKTPHCTICRNK